MNANEFLHKKDVAYMKRLSTSLDFNEIVSLMEEYAALRQPPVMCRSCSKELTQGEIDRQLKVVGVDDIDLAICDECELDNYCIHLHMYDA